MKNIAVNTVKHLDMIKTIEPRQDQSQIRITCPALGV